MGDDKKHICKYCNKEFKSGQSLGAHIVHCKENPNSHQNEWINKKKEKYELENPLQDYLLKCIVCEKEYTLQLRKKQYEQGKYRKTCCNECSHKLSSLNTNVKEKNKKISEAFPKLKHIKVCPICGNKFESTTKANFCSQKCRNIHLSNILKGNPKVGGIRYNAYKKYNPDYMKDMELAYKRMSRDVEKTIDDICTYVSGTAQTAGAKYSCEVKEGTSYNFFVLTTPAEGDTTINLIMDRNICEDGTPATAENKCLVAWLSKDDYINNDGPNTEQFTDGGGCQLGNVCSVNELGPITAITYLNNATSTWENIDNLDLTYDDEGENFTGFALNGKARLPYKSEVSAYDSTNKTNAYLYDYLNSNNNVQTNIISGIHGYWTLSSTSDSSRAWYVYDYGNVGISERVYSDNYNGVRPVINLKI